MIYDDIKKILKEKYQRYQYRFENDIIEEKFLSKETIKNNPYYILYEKNDDKFDPEAIEYMKNLPKGFTYRPVNEYIELIVKVINDIRTKYIKDLTEEQLDYVNQNIESYEQRIKMLPKEESLENSINFWKILIEATKLYKYAREKSLENIRKNINLPQKEKSKPKTNQMTISDYERELDRRSGKLRKKGIDALIDKISSGQQPPQQVSSVDVPTSPLATQKPAKTPQDEIKSLNSMEKFLLSVKDDIDQTMYKTAFDALQKAKADPSPENIQLAKDLVDQALES